MLLICLLRLHYGCKSFLEPGLSLDPFIFFSSHQYKCRSKLSDLLWSVYLWLITSPSSSVSLMICFCNDNHKWKMCCYCELSPCRFARSEASSGRRRQTVRPAADGPGDRHPAGPPVGDVCGEAQRHEGSRHRCPKGISESWKAVKSHRPGKLCFPDLGRLWKTTDSAKVLEMTSKFVHFHVHGRANYLRRNNNSNLTNFLNAASQKRLAC